jgi:ABC-type multidrug transport system ATPase subunit
MDEAERLCDRVAVIDAGRILAEDTPARLIAEVVGDEVVEVEVADDDARSRAAEALAAHFEVEAHDSVVRGFGRAGVHPEEAALGALATASESVTRRRATLEDVFLRLTGRDLRE